LPQFRTEKWNPLFLKLLLPPEDTRVTDRLKAELEELFANLGGVSVRRMFGGFGIFRDGVMFALSIRGLLHLKADEATMVRFRAEGSTPFAYDNRGRTVTTSYWRVPDRLLDDPDEFREWALGAIDVAARTGTAEKPKKRRPAGP
jgi:DNA transformation protein